MARERKKDVGVLAFLPPAAGEGEGRGDGCALEACAAAALEPLDALAEDPLALAEGAGEACAARLGVGEAERKLEDARSAARSAASAAASAASEASADSSSADSPANSSPLA